MDVFETVEFSDDNVNFTDDEDDVTFYDKAMRKEDRRHCTLAELSQLAVAYAKVNNSLDYLNRLEVMYVKPFKSDTEKKFLPYRIKMQKLKVQFAYDKLNYIMGKIKTNIMYRNNHNLYKSDFE
jgi:hypothetical protein